MTDTIAVIMTGHHKRPPNVVVVTDTIAVISTGHHERPPNVVVVTDIATDDLNGHLNFCDHRFILYFDLWGYIRSDSYWRDVETYNGDGEMDQVDQ